MNLRMWKQKMIALGGILFFGLFIWMVSHADGQSDSASIKGYGGRLPFCVQGSLGRMKLELKGAKRILVAENDRFCFIDRNGIQHEYGYAYETLWCDDYPVVKNVRAFNFEYRDGADNLLTLSRGNFSSVTKIGYTIRLKTDGEDILASSRIDISSRRQDSTMESENQVALAD